MPLLPRVSCSHCFSRPRRGIRPPPACVNPQPHHSSRNILITFNASLAGQDGPLRNEQRLVIKGMNTILPAEMPSLSHVSDNCVTLR